MRRYLPPLRSLVAFEAAARRLSFTKAGEELAVTQGAISAQISKLEAFLRTELFIRKIREVSLTEEGERLARSCRKAFDGLEREAGIIASGRLSDILTVDVSTYVATRWLSRRLNTFLSSNPRAVVRLQHSVNTPEFHIDDVDIAIRWGTGHWPDARAELLLPMPMRVVCNPTLLEGENGIRTPRDLLGHTFLSNVPESDLWGEWLNLVGLDRSDIRSELTLADSNVRVQAAIDGHGVVLADDLVADDIAAGRLATPFSEQLESYGHYLLRPAGVEERAVSEAFRRWLMASAHDSEHGAGYDHYD